MTGRTVVNVRRSGMSSVLYSSKVKSKKPGDKDF